jgi:uncharacterized protein YbaR (Trm112 family)
MALVRPSVDVRTVKVPQPDHVRSMLDSQLLEILVCPETKQPLRLVERSEVDRLLGEVDGEPRTLAGGEVAQMEGALVREDGIRLYPIRDGIPIMLIDEAVELS